VTSVVGRAIRARLAERRAVAEYRHAWRRLRHLHSAADRTPLGSNSTGSGPILNNNWDMSLQSQDQEEQQ
jgi:hypothetical protein